MSINKLTVGTEGAVGNSRGSDLKVLTDALISTVEHPSSGLSALSNGISKAITVSDSRPGEDPKEGERLWIFAGDGESTLYANLANKWHPDHSNIILSGAYVKIQAFGDSITANGGSRAGDGSWIISNRAWWSNALIESNQDFFLSDSKGVSGDQTTDLLARMGDVLNDDADVIMILIGTNDITQGRSVADIKASMTDIVDQILAAGKVVVVVPVLKRPVSSGVNDEIDLLNAAYRDIASTRPKMTVIADVKPFNDIMTSPDYAKVAPDKLHPGGYGCELISKHVGQELDKLIISKSQDNTNIISADFTGGDEGLLLNGATGKVPTGWGGYFADPSEGGTYSDRGVGYTVNGDNSVSFKSGTTTGNSKVLLRVREKALNLAGFYKVECEIELTSNIEDLSYFAVYISNVTSSVMSAIKLPDSTAPYMSKIIKISTPYTEINSASLGDYFYIRLESTNGTPIVGKVSNPKLIKLA